VVKFANTAGVAQMPAGRQLLDGASI